MSAELVRIRVGPLAVEVDGPRGALLVSSLSDHGVEFPCGGTGLCGGCGVRVLAGWLPATDADRRAFPAEQLASGWRLGGPGPGAATPAVGGGPRALGG